MNGRIGIEELLAWYRDAGVDEPLSTEPLDRFVESETIAAERRTKAPLPAPAVKIARDVPALPAARSPDAVAEETRALAADCADLASLEAAIRDYEGCGLKGSARRTVFAVGDPSATLAIVGDVPDRDEDAEGTPFAGAAGAMLERMLSAIGVDAAASYRLPASPWRTPGQRPLTPQEKAQLAPFLRRHLELAQPKTVLVMGSAAELLLGANKRLPALRGRVHALTLGEHEAATVCTFHPNFLLRQPEQKRLAWADLLLLRAHLSGA